MPNEKELIIALHNGSHEAFRQLYEFYHERVFYFIYGLIHSRSSTEELFQSVFLKIWENRRLIDEESSFSGYIYQIARNSAYLYLRKKLYEKELEIYLNNTTGFDEHRYGESKLMTDDFSIFINRLIDQLPEQRKKIFLLHYQQHKTHKEIMQLLHISKNTVATQISRALDFLRTEISKEVGLGAPFILALLLCS